MYHATEFVLVSAYRLQHFDADTLEEYLEQSFAEYHTEHPMHLHSLTYTVLREVKPGIMEVAVSGNVELLDDEGDELYPG